MDGEQLLEKLKGFYASTFDLEEGHSLGTERYSLYGHFNVDNSRYVLVKQAKLWEANSQEHLFVKHWHEGDGALDEEALRRLLAPLEQVAEPQYVRKGEKYPPKNHMYSFLTLVILTESDITPEAASLAKKYRFSKTYLFNFRGYLETRLVLVSLKDSQIITNQNGRQLFRTYRKLME